MTQGSNSRIGIATGRVAAGANVEAVMSNSLGISRPRLRRASPRKGSDSRPNTTDHSGATVPDLHRLPSATRVGTIRALGALSIEPPIDCSKSKIVASRAERKTFADQDLILTDLTIDGQKREVLLHAEKNGFFYVLDRKTGQFISAKNFVDVNWATGYTAEGKPIEIPGARGG